MVMIDIRGAVEFSRDYLVSYGLDVIDYGGHVLDVRVVGGIIRLRFSLLGVGLDVEPPGLLDGYRFKWCAPIWGLEYYLEEVAHLCGEVNGGGVI